MFFFYTPLNPRRFILQCVKNFLGKETTAAKWFPAKRIQQLFFFLNICSIALHLIWIKEIDLGDLMRKKSLKQSDFLFLF